jgi:hypothetical protein
MSFTLSLRVFRITIRHWKYLVRVRDDEDDDQDDDNDIGDALDGQKLYL